jgi:hypothetical protein
LDETYERTLLGIDEEKWEYALRLFQCLTVCRRPLKVRELAEVLAVELDAGAIPKLNAELRPKDANEAVLSACSTLIAIVPGRYYWDLPVVQFSHYSVKEFLTSDRLESSRPTLSRFYISPRPAHLVLVQSCISTLLQVEWAFNDGLPLAEYAAVSWVDHAQVFDVASHIQIGMESLFDPERPHFAKWVDFRRERLSFSRLLEEPRDCLSFAALYGFDHLVKYLLATRRHDSNAPDPDSDTLLQALFRVDPNTRDDKGLTPLHQASRSGHVTIVAELLLWGASVDSRDHDFSTPLCEASLHGHTKIVELLLESGADVDARKYGYHTSLRAVVEKRNFDLARLLLAYGADPNAQDERGWTPLHLASICGYLQIVSLLLDRGANVNSQEGQRRTPLHLAASCGHADTARWLMKHGADLQSRDDHGRTPFSVALETGNRKVARLLSDWVS